MVQPLLTDPDVEDNNEKLAIKSKSLKSITSDPGDRTIEYRTVPYRWLILLVVTLAQLTGNLIFVTLQPIAIPTTQAFNLGSVLYVNFAVILNSLNAIPMTFFCVWAFSRYSTSNVLRIVISVLLIGTIFRSLCVRTDNFWPVFVGSFFCSCCNPFFINVQSIIANKWFGDNERALATSL